MKIFIQVEVSKRGSVYAARLTAEALNLRAEAYGFDAPSAVDRAAMELESMIRMQGEVARSGARA